MGFSKRQSLVYDGSASGFLPFNGDKSPGVPANVYIHVYLGPSRTTFATLSVPSVSVADFAKRSSPAALDVAVTVSHDSVPAQGSAAIAPAMASSTGISNCGRRRLARRETCTVLRGVCPQPGSQSRCVCDMQINQKPPRLQTARSVAAAKAGRGRGNRRRRGCQPV